MSDRRSYGLTPDDVRTIRRALAGRREDVQADPDYADDERAEHLADIKNATDALDVADYQRELAVPFVHVVNRFNEVDPLYVFEREEDARAFAERDGADTTVSEEVVITAAEAPKFLAETADEN